MILAIAVGVFLASLLFMRRMSELSRVRLSLPPPSPMELPKLPREIVLYQLVGPLCFGGAAQALAIIENLHRECKVVILDFDRVPAIDVTGFVALEQVLERLGRSHITVILAGQLPEPHRVIDNETFRQRHDNVYFSDAIEDAIPLGLGFLEVAASD
jgi:SulP family sulfate permease